MTKKILLAVVVLIISVALAAIYFKNGDVEAVKVSLDKKQTGEIRIPPPAFPEENVVYFGFDLRLTPKEDVKLYLPFIQYLSEKTGYTFKIRFTKDYESTQENLGRGITQFAALGPVSYIQAHREYGVVCLAKGLNKENRGEYQAVIFTRPDSDVKNIEDLKGRTFAFGPRDSTQGNLIPRNMLEDVNITLNDLQKYEYTSSHKDTAEAVISGRCDAGGMQDTLAWKMAEEGRIRIINVSKWYPSSTIAADKGVDPELLEEVERVLLELDPQGKHKTLLPGWDKTEMPNGFTEADHEDYAELEEIAIKYGIVK